MMQNKLTILLALVLLMFMSAVIKAETLKRSTLSTPVEGRHYTVLKNPGKTKAPTGKVEVIEFFWYGCPHCYRLEPYMESWEASKSDDAYLRRIPVSYNNLWNLHARTFYTAEKLKVLKKSHRPFFDAIHKERKPLTSQRAIAGFFTQYGITTKNFNDTFSSFSVEARMRLASKDSDFYKINGVPNVIINGKYKTSPGLAGSEANMITVIRYLVEQERKNPSDTSG